MRHAHLTTYQRHRLKELSQSPDRFVARKSIALLELDQGRLQVDVAESLGVDERTIRNWVLAFSNRDLRVALHDHRAGRSGRPRKWSQRCQHLFEDALSRQPDEFGYQAVVWTAELLAIHLEKRAGVRLSRYSIRNRLREHGYVWKRPRYQFKTDTQKRKKNGNAQVLVSSSPRESRHFLRR